MNKALGATKVRSAAREQWGPVNSVKQVVKGVWSAETWGHGGYLVAVGPHEPFQLDERLRVPRFKGSEWTLAGVPVVTFYAFEEDCDWAVLMLAHPEMLRPFPTHVTLDDARQCVARWNPDFLRVESDATRPVVVGA